MIVGRKLRRRKLRAGRTVEKSGRRSTTFQRQFSTHLCQLHVEEADLEAGEVETTGHEEDRIQMAEKALKIAPQVGRTQLQAARIIRHLMSVSKETWVLLDRVLSIQSKGVLSAPVRQAPENRHVVSTDLKTNAMKLGGNSLGQGRFVKIGEYRSQCRLIQVSGLHTSLDQNILGARQSLAISIKGLMGLESKQTQGFPSIGEVKVMFVPKTMGVIPLGTLFHASVVKEDLSVVGVASAANHHRATRTLEATAANLQMANLTVPVSFKLTLTSDMGRNHTPHLL